MSIISGLWIEFEPEIPTLNGGKGGHGPGNHGGPFYFANDCLKQERLECAHNWLNCCMINLFNCTGILENMIINTVNQACYIYFAQSKCSMRPQNTTWNAVNVLTLIIDKMKLTT